MGVLLGDDIAEFLYDEAADFIAEDHRCTEDQSCRVCEQTHIDMQCGDECAWCADEVELMEAAQHEDWLRRTCAINDEALD